MGRMTAWLAIPLALTLILGMVLAGNGLTLAQDEDEDVTPPPGEDVLEGYPAYIHPGSCADPIAEPAFSLGDITPHTAMDDDDVLPPVGDIGDFRGLTGASPVAQTSTTLDVQFDNLLNPDEPHALAVHASPDEFGTFVACGNVGGREDDGRVVFGLTPVNDSNLAGIAVLDEDDAGFLGLGDEETQVTVYLYSLTAPMAPEDVATPEPVEATEEGFAHPEWLIDPQELQEQILEEFVILIGVIPIDDETEEGFIPGTTQFDQPVLSLPETSDDAIELWRSEIEQRVSQFGGFSEDPEEVPSLQPGDMVVLYDNGTFEAMRMWWILDYLGHEEKRILDGGLAAWVEEAELNDNGVPATGPGLAPAAPGVPTPYPSDLQPEVLATLETVQSALEDSDIILLDVRPASEYDAGHIPGAVNVPFTENLAEGEPRRWQDAEHLRALYAEVGITPESPVIAYGDTGPGATVTYVTLRLLGHDDVQVYPPGWTEWSQYPDLPRATGAEVDEAEAQDDE